MAISSASKSPLSPPNEATPAAGTVLTGVPVVPGIAYAPVIRPGRHPVLEFVAKAIEVAEADRDAELARFSAAAAAVADRLRERAAARDGVGRRGARRHGAAGPGPGVAGRVREADRRRERPRCGPPSRPPSSSSDMFTALGGLMAERVTDVRDVRDRVVAELTGQAEPGVPSPDVPSVLLADDLAPADTAGLDPTRVVGLATRLGGPDQPHRDHRPAARACPASSPSAASTTSPTGATVLRRRRAAGRSPSTPDADRRPRRGSTRRSAAAERAGRLDRARRPRRTGTRCRSWPTCRTAPLRGRPRGARRGRRPVPHRAVLPRTATPSRRSRSRPTIYAEVLEAFAGRKVVHPHPGRRLGQAAGLRHAARRGQPGARRARLRIAGGNPGCSTASSTRSPRRPSATGIDAVGDGADGGHRRRGGGLRRAGARARARARRDDRGARRRRCTPTGCSSTSTSCRSAPTTCPSTRWRPTGCPPSWPT